MIDTHCHLTVDRLHEQLETVLANAAAAGVSQLITIGTGLADDEKCVAVCQDRPWIRCAVGVHPGHVDEEDIAQLERLRTIQSDPAVVALGEMGLDYHYGKANRDRQFHFFEYQLKLADEVGKPVVIHCREALDDCMGILRQFPKVPALFHCFSGSAADARRILNAGYLLGFTGIVTFKNAGELRDVVQMTPADRFVVETDAPWLSPEPMRKVKTNEPALVMHTAAFVAQLRGIRLKELDALTTANAGRFFGCSG